mgnify:CR=1 FL=1
MREIVLDTETTGLDLTEGGRPTIRNTILSDNLGKEIYIRNSGSQVVDVDYSVIQGGNENGIYFEGSNGSVTYGTNNISNTDALFSDLDNNDFTLGQYSKAIGAGSNSFAALKDIQGNSRPNPSGSNPDIGAYESSRGIPIPKPTLLTVNQDGSGFFTSIEDAISFASNGDTILISPGIYPSLTLIDADIQAAQATWDAQSDEEKARPGNSRPTDITLP